MSSWPSAHLRFEDRPEPDPSRNARPTLDPPAGDEDWSPDVPVEDDGTLGIVDGLSAPGKRLRLRAEIDTLVLVSNCPQVNNPCNGFDPTPVRMVVTSPEPL